MPVQNDPDNININGICINVDAVCEKADHFHPLPRRNLPRESNYSRVSISRWLMTIPSPADKRVRVLHINSTKHRFSRENRFAEIFLAESRQLVTHKRSAFN